MFPSECCFFFLHHHHKNAYGWYCIEWYILVLWWGVSFIIWRHFHYAYITYHARIWRVDISVCINVSRYVCCSRPRAHRSGLQHHHLRRKISVYCILYICMYTTHLPLKPQYDRIVLRLCCRLLFVIYSLRSWFPPVICSSSAVCWSPARRHWPKTITSSIRSISTRTRTWCANRSSTTRRRRTSSTVPRRSQREWIRWSSSGWYWCNCGVVRAN